jgi:hypothetical protein
MTQTMLGVIAAASILLSGLPCGAAEPVDEPLHPLFERTWIAASGGAQAVTGDVVMTPDTITFDGRVTFQWRYVTKVTRKEPSPALGDMLDFSLYEILDPRPEEIRNGYQLMGSTRDNYRVDLPRYIAVGADHRTDYDELALIVYGTSETPDIETSFGHVLGYFAYPVLRYEPFVVSLNGFLVVKEYRESSGGMLRKPHLILDSPIAIQGDPEYEEDFPSFGSIQWIDLIVPDADADFWARLGHHVVLEGTLSPGNLLKISPDDSTAVFMTVRKPRPTK